MQKTREEAKQKIIAVKNEASKAVQTIKSNYEVRENILAMNERKAIARRSELFHREVHIGFEIEREAENMIREKSASLERKHESETNNLKDKYHKMTVGYKTIFFFTLFYGIISTILTAWKTESFRFDFVIIFKTIFKGILIALKGIISIAKLAARLGNIISQPKIAGIIHWVILIIVSAGIIIGLGLLIISIGKKYVDFFRQKQADEISVFVGLVILAIIVFLADFIKSMLSINLLLLMILMFVGYTVARGFLEVENNEIK